MHQFGQHKLKLGTQVVVEMIWRVTSGSLVGEFHSSSEHTLHLLTAHGSADHAAFPKKIQVFAIQRESLYYCTELSV